MKYDYVIQNGYVIDPAVSTETVKSVYIRNNRIVEPPVDGTVEDAVVINASGCLVLPGLIDFHTHLGYQLSDFGLNPDLYTLPNGITAAVDAGSGGTANFEGMYQNVFSRAMITIRSFLNVAATGIITERYLENLDPSRFDEKKMALLFDRYKDVLLGFKVRVGRNTSGERNLEPLKRTVELAERSSVGSVCMLRNWTRGMMRYFASCVKGISSAIFSKGIIRIISLAAPTT